MELRRLEVKWNLVQGRGDDDFNSPVTNLSELTNVIDTIYRWGQRQVFIAYYEDVTPEELPGRRKRQEAADRWRGELQ